MKTPPPAAVRGHDAPSPKPTLLAGVLTALILAPPVFATLWAIRLIFG